MENLHITNNEAPACCKNKRCWIEDKWNLATKENRRNQCRTRMPSCSQQSPYSSYQNVSAHFKQTCSARDGPLESVSVWIPLYSERQSLKTREVERLRRMLELRSTYHFQPKIGWDPAVFFCPLLLLNRTTSNLGIADTQSKTIKIRIKKRKLDRLISLMTDRLLRWRSPSKLIPTDSCPNNLSINRKSKIKISKFYAYHLKEMKSCDVKRQSRASRTLGE